MKTIHELSQSVISKMQSKSSIAIGLGATMQLIFWGSFLLHQRDGSDMFSFMTNLQYTLMMSAMGLVILIRGLHLGWEARSIARLEALTSPQLGTWIRSAIQRTIRVSVRVDSITVALLVTFVGYVWLFTPSSLIPDWRILPLAACAALVFLLVQQVTRYIEKREYSKFLEDLKPLTP
ncbi:MAG: hypothetical protein AAGA85_03720 [Bacteroidota bacterium]